MSKEIDVESKSAADLGEVTVEVVGAGDYYDVDSDGVPIDVHTHLRDGVRRKLKPRHAQMIALAGAIGTGLFLGSGKAISHAGPAGALLAYATIGSLVWAMIWSLGEMMCFAPVSGGYIHFVERYVHPSFGFAIGYMQWYSAALSLPSELIAASIIIGFWTEMTAAKTAGFLVMLIVLSVSISFLGVRAFGEAEFFFSWLKIFLILGLILAGLVVDLGGGPNHERIGFRYWKDPGAFAPYIVTGSIGKFCGWFYTLVQAAYSFGGIESIAMTGGEMENPRVNTAKAVRKLFYRIFVFYVLGVLIAGMLVPYNDSSLLKSTGNAAQSPFVLAFTRAGVKVLPSVINAGVLCSAWSTANQNIYSGSRMLYGLALRGQAPKFFAKTTKGGLPLPSVALISCFALLSFMTLSSEAVTVLNWLNNLTSIAQFFTWGGILVAFIRWKSAMDSQGRDRSASPYLYLKIQPLPAYYGLAWCAIIIFFNGFYVFIRGNWTVSNFIISYINIPIFLGLVLGHWLSTGRPGFKAPVKIDLVSNIPGPEVDVDPNPPTTRLGRFWVWLL